MFKKKIKCVVVGDGTVGKTSLLVRYLQNHFSTEYTPTIFDDFAVDIPINGENYELHLFDTAGQEEYDQVRKLAFIDVDVFLVCFAIDSMSSYENVSAIWIPELQRLCPDVPLLLIGTKIDVRITNHAEKQHLITTVEGEMLRKKWRISQYLECSALTEENVTIIFEETINTVIHKQSALMQNDVRHSNLFKNCCIIA